MRKISWAKVNKILMFERDREEAIASLQEKYPIEFPVWRMRSQWEGVELYSYEEVVNEYATSGKKANERKNNLLWGR